MKTRQTAKHGAMLALATLALMVVPRPASAGNWVANSVPDLIAAINAANQAGGDNTIVLAGGTTYTLTAVDNTSNGPNGLPVIAAGNNLTIVGNGATIARSAASKTPSFRFFYVASLYTANCWISLASLRLKDLTLTGGLAQLDTYDSPACGGAIYNYGGALTLDGVTVTGNSAVGSGYDYGWVYAGRHDRYRVKWAPVSGQRGVGGGIYSYFGSLTLTGGTLIAGNSAVGFNNGEAWGGGVYAVGGAVVLSGVALASNQAVGGDSGRAGANGAPAYAGGLYVDRRCDVTLTDVEFSSNVASGGKGTLAGGEARGGALCLYGDSFVEATLTNVTMTGNAALGGGGKWGGDARGGALAVYGYSARLMGSNLSSNRAVGGDGDRSGSGGGGYGGAIHLMGNMFDSFTLSLREDSITGNSASGGSPPGGNSAAHGGGIYHVVTWPTAQLDVDASTYAQTTGNQPDDMCAGPFAGP